MSLYRFAGSDIVIAISDEKAEAYNRVIAGFDEFDSDELKMQFKGQREDINAYNKVALIEWPHLQ